LSCTTINDVVSKFVNSCTQVTGQPNTAMPYISKIIHSAAETADVEIIEVTFVVVIIITLTMIPNTIMVNVEVTIETVATRVEATTTITQVMFK